MASDLGPGDLVVAVRSAGGGDGIGAITEGTRYVVQETPTNWHLGLECQFCGQVAERSVILQGVSFHECRLGRLGLCSCLVRRIGGDSVLAKFRKELLRPVHVPHDPVLVPEDA
jgi:hypothetical protein